MKKYKHFPLMNTATKSEAKYILYDYYFRKSRAKGRGRVCAREGCRQGMCGVRRNYKYIWPFRQTMACEKKSPKH